MKNGRRLGLCGPSRFGVGATGCRRSNRRAWPVTPGGAQREPPRLRARRTSGGVAALAALACLLALVVPAATAHGSRQPPWIVLFDGRSTAGWTMTGPGGFSVQSGALVSDGGMGLLWYERRRFRNFELEIDWKVARRCDNSGIFVRFPGRPRTPADAVRSGYEIQIDDCDPNGAAYRTGGIYAAAPAARLASRPAAQWNRYLIRVVGQHYTVILNGTRVTDFDGARGMVGYVGLQNHDAESRVSFRRVRVRPR